MFALILDDGEMNNVLMSAVVRQIGQCEPRVFTRPTEALAFIGSHAGEIGVATVDYEMPEMNGTAFIRAARRLPDFSHVPIVMVTSMTDRSIRREALEAGATDFLSKPFDHTEVKVRLTNLLALNDARRAEMNRASWLTREVARATQAIEAREREVVTLLMKAAEHRDTDTGDHVARVAAYVTLIAEALGLDEAETRRLSLASTMHDVGKLAVPDAILLKPGRLTPEERVVMEEHAERGSRILEGSTSDVVELAAEIALTHHEKWDGTGYPNKLAGNAIPLPGRIVAVADVFDALTTERPYKKAWSLDEARSFILTNAGVHFDPVCVAAFLSRWTDVKAISAQIVAHAPAAKAAAR
jgi:putative two-component system response regulator